MPPSTLEYMAGKGAGVDFHFSCSFCRACNKRGEIGSSIVQASVDLITLLH
jgi:hypothetical protein